MALGVGCFIDIFIIAFLFISLLFYVVLNCLFAYHLSCVGDNTQKHRKSVAEEDFRIGQDLGMTSRRPMNNVTSQALTYAWSLFGHLTLLHCLYILLLYTRSNQLTSAFIATIRKYTHTMETVNKVVDAGYKAIWGEQQNTDTTNTQTTASGSQTTTSTGMTGIQSVDKVVEAGKKAIWGESTESQQQIPHGEEPVAGKRGLGTATDPYDAGNRDGKLLFFTLS